MKKTLILTIAIIIASITAEARRDQVREVKQEARIRQGLKSGELTKQEAKGLALGQKRIDRAQRKAKADGNVSAAEAARLEKMQDGQSKRIYNQKHDEQKK